MSLAAQVAITIVASLHLGFLVLEMFLWDKPTGRKIFGHNQEQARITKVLAANQGLYNGFLAAGLFWALWARPHDPAIVTFFLICVLVAGLYGAATASRTILWVQALPAAIALGLVLWT